MNITVVSEIPAGLRIEAERHRAVAVGIAVDGVVVTGIGRDHRETHSKGVATLLALQIAERVAEISIGSAAAFEEETSIPIRGQTQMEADGVALRVHARAFVHPALDLAMLRQSGCIALRCPRRVQRGGIDHGSRVGEPGH